MTRTDEWHIKGVSLETRKKIKLFALSHDLTLAQALDRLVSMAAVADDRKDQKQSGTNLRDEVPTEGEIERLLDADA